MNRTRSNDTMHSLVSVVPLKSCERASHLSISNDAWRHQLFVSTFMLHPDDDPAIQLSSSHLTATACSWMPASNHRPKHLLSQGRMLSSRRCRHESLQINLRCWFGCIVRVFRLIIIRIWNEAILRATEVKFWRLRGVDGSQIRFLSRK